MLFDLKGRRRRVVQATYLTLAVLMGGGLVLFGIGGDVSGGLFDAFSDRSGNSGSGLVGDRIERAEERLRKNPRDEAAMRDLVRGNYQQASDKTPSNATAFAEDARGDLEEAGQAWDRYLALDPKRPDAGLANIALQIFGQGGLNQPDKAVVAAEIIAEDRPSPNAFLQVAQYAAAAGQDRKADLAGEEAVRRAPRSERSTVRELVKQAKAGPQQQQQQQQAPPG